MVYAHTISYVREIKCQFCFEKQINPWAATKKLTQISRISKKSLLCNALINTHPND